ncbi:hypothetical protein ROE7235_03765 [Roseibaca ekhonensis]|uniref:Uncharacterized protein n=1 Tax=Roseinatronobacter ekhonensis TaxID=254356 RepID=A0A3B0MZ24_9RHOB|nr:hypothetical protein ROE7235_03765 [Roseibaca ekhonensis]
MNVWEFGVVMNLSPGKLMWGASATVFFSQLVQHCFHFRTRQMLLRFEDDHFMIKGIAALPGWQITIVF